MAECASCGRGIRGRPPPADNRPRFCSSTCATDESPKVWDGKTRYSELRRTRTYEAVCMLCGRQSYHDWTEEEVRALKPWRCEKPFCGGVVHVELLALAT